jgi:DNA polymerase III alpha subunit (gram-positive type)
MKNGAAWVIIDTETDGLSAPIHVVELAAQFMRGWDPVGEPFRMYLNHEVRIPTEAIAVHGYTQAYLRKNGRDPREVHEAFRAYVKDCPLVAHNLTYDWDRTLLPEWARLGIPPIGKRGFCTLTLARRLVPEIRSHRLNKLKSDFRLLMNRSHEALSDVQTVVELFQKVLRPRLELAGIDTFEAIAGFAKLAPIAKCVDLIRSGQRVSGRIIPVQMAVRPSMLDPQEREAV